MQGNFGTRVYHFIKQGCHFGRHKFLNTKGAVGVKEMTIFFLLNP